MKYFYPLTEEVGACCYLSCSQGESQEWSIKWLNLTPIKVEGKTLAGLSDSKQNEKTKIYKAPRCEGARAKTLNT